jgi:hypothetical protein
MPDDYSRGLAIVNRLSKKRFRLGSLGLLLAIVLGGLSAQAEQDVSLERQRSLQEEIKAIQSVAQVKSQIKNLFTARDNCAVGSCHNSTSTSICNAVGMLDVRVNGQIINQMKMGDSNSLPISKADLSLMQQIFSQCKPSNYQYWNWDTVLHVVYSPTCAEDQKIRQQFALAPSNRCRRSKP